MITDLPAFRLQLRLRSGALVVLREQLGLGQAAAARAIGISVGTLCQYETLKLDPILASGHWRPSAVKISAYFRLDPEVIWPAEVREVKKSAGAIDLTAEQARVLRGAPSSPEAARLLSDGLGKLDALLGALTPIESRTLKQSFVEGETLKNIGRRHDVSGSRMAQIREQALRKLRRHLEKNPADVDALRGALEVML